MAVYIGVVLVAVLLASGGVADSPGHIRMIVSPRRPIYKVGDLVDLECVGRLDSDEWMWQTKDFPRDSPWTPVSTGTQQTCTEFGVSQMSGGSSLLFQLKKEDERRTYKCSDKNDEYSADFSFRVIDA